MKTSKIKLVGIVALSFIMLFALTACDSDSDNGNGTPTVDTYSVTFSVVDGDGNAVEGAEVALDGSEGTETGTTGTDGKVTISELEGEYTYTVTYNGTEFASGEVTSSDDGTDIDVDVSEDPGAVEAVNASVETEFSDSVIVEFNSIIDFIDFRVNNAVATEDFGFSIKVNGTEATVTDVYPFPENAKIDDALDNDQELRRLYEKARSIETEEAWDNYYNYLWENYAETYNVVVETNTRIREDDGVSISYDADATGSVHTDIFGNELGSFDLDATNNVEQPRIASAVVENDYPKAVKVEYDAEMNYYDSDDNLVLGNTTSSGLTVSVNDADGVSLTTAEAINEKTVRYELPEAVQTDDDVTISYESDVDATNIYDIYGNELVETTDFAVTNETAVPEFVAAYIGDEDTPATTGTTVIVELSETVTTPGGINAAVLAEDGFTVRDSAGEQVELAPSDAITVGEGDNGNYVTITLDEEVTSEATGYTVSYDEDLKTVLDESGNPLAGFNNETIVNNLVAPDAVALETAEVVRKTNKTNVIELEFNQAVTLEEDDITLMYDGSELTDYEITTNGAEIIDLTVGFGEFGDEYASGDATIAIENTDKEIDVPVTDVADGVKPLLETVTAVDTETMEFEFSEDVTLVDFKAVLQTEYDMTGATVAADGSVVTVTAGEGIDFPYSYEEDVKLGEDAVEDAAGNENDETTSTVVDEVSPEFTGITEIPPSTLSAITLEFSENIQKEADSTLDDSDFEVVLSAEGSLPITLTTTNVEINTTESIITLDIVAEDPFAVTTGDAVSVEILSPEKIVDTATTPNALLEDPLEQEIEVTEAE